MANNNKQKNKKQKSKKKNNIVLPIIAAAVVVVAAVSVIVPKLTKDSSSDNTSAKNTTQNQISSVQSFTNDITINKDEIGETATFFDYDANGITVEAFAVKASDGTTRIALNTCQVCNGSPYAYFVQQGDNFICQNCKNAFKRDSIGTIHGGCNPLPLTEDDYTDDNGIITIPAYLLEQYAPNFKNWKKF